MNENNNWSNILKNNEDKEIQCYDYLSFVIDNIDDILEKRVVECKEYTLKMVELLSKNYELLTQFLQKMNIFLEEYDNVKVKSILPNNREYVKIKKCFINCDVNLYLLSNMQGYSHITEKEETTNLIFGFEYKKNATLIAINKLAEGYPLMSCFIKLIGYKEK